MDSPLGLPHPPLAAAPPSTENPFAATPSTKRQILRAHTSWNRTGDAQCSGNGLVVAAGTFLAACDCFWGWQGDDCSAPLAAAPKGAIVYMAYGEEKSVGSLAVPVSRAW